MEEKYIKDLQHTLTVPAKFKNLNKIRGFVKKYSRKAGFNEADSYKIQLAVDEACSNIIEHAYTDGTQGEIVCGCEFSDEEFTIQLIDFGQSFDPKRVSSPDLSTNLQDRKTGGLGLYFIRQLMDEVTFTIVPASVPIQSPGYVSRPGNVLIMVKRKPKSE